MMGVPGMLRNRSCMEPEKLKVFDFQPGTDYTHKADGLEGIHNIYLGVMGCIHLIQTVKLQKEQI